MEWQQFRCFQQEEDWDIPSHPLCSLLQKTNIIMDLFQKPLLSLPTLLSVSIQSTSLISATSLSHSKNHYFIKWIFLPLFNLQNSYPKRTYTLWNIDSKWQRVLNTKSQETEDGVPSSQSKMYSAHWHLLHQPLPVHLKGQSRTWTLKLDTSSDRTTRLFQNFIITAFHHVKFTLKHN